MTRKIKILRNLAHQIAEIAELPIMEERRHMWKQHNQLKRVRPMILVFPEGSWRELTAVGASLPGRGCSSGRIPTAPAYIPVSPYTTTVW